MIAERYKKYLCFKRVIIHFGLALTAVVFMHACRLEVSPGSQQASPQILGPNSVAVRENPVTKTPTANFLSVLRLKQSSKENVDALLDQHEMWGRKIMLPGDQDPRYLRLQQIFDRIVAVSHLKDTNAYPILIASPEFQAQTFGGDEVIFYTGLSERIPDAALAFVIAHELAHIAAGHVGEATSLGVINTQTGFENRRQNDLYSYGHEKEADIIALIYLYLAGFDSQPAIALWQDMAKQSRRQTYDLFIATHPASTERAKYLAENAQYFRQRSSEYTQDNLLNCNPFYCSIAHEGKAGELAK